MILKNTMKTKDFLEIGLVLLMMFMVGKLAYQQGEYDGMQEICGDKKIYVERGQYICLEEEEAEELKAQQMNIGIGGTSPDIGFNLEDFV